jgi:hypothetical protein
VNAILSTCILALLVLAACSDGTPGNSGVQGSSPAQWTDPQRAYADLVDAAHAADGAAMYEALDHNHQTGMDAVLQSKVAELDQMPESQRQQWEPIKGLEGKEAFAKWFSMNSETMTEPFKGDYTVLKVDTLVVLTVQHTGRPADLMYMRWENGAWRVTSPPLAPQSAMPQGHPDVGTSPQQLPEGHPEVGNPHQSMPQQAPQGESAPGDTAK